MHKPFVLFVFSFIMSYLNIIAPANHALQSFGQSGFRLIDPTVTVNPEGEFYRVIYALDDSIISTVSAKGDSLSSIPVLAGAVLYGLFSEVYCETGVIIAYIA